MLERPIERYSDTLQTLDMVASLVTGRDPPHPAVRDNAMSESAPRRRSRWSRREGRVIRYSAHAAIRSAIASGASMCRK
jgi:hypothetical protein